MILLPESISFEWNARNQLKNWMKHKISQEECEEAFLDTNKKLLKDILHSGREDRLILLGKTLLGRVLFMVFTVKKRQLRVISARPLNKKELHLYEKTN
jgi:uncharacterized DUF497 family protein